MLLHLALGCHTPPAFSPHSLFLKVPSHLLTLLTWSGISFLATFILLVILSSHITLSSISMPMVPKFTLPA